MRIAILNQPQDPIAAADEQRGSVAIVHWELAKLLAASHEVILYAPRASGQAAVERLGSIEIRRVPLALKGLHRGAQLALGRFDGRRPYSTSPLYFREYFRWIARDLRERRADIVHVPQQWQFAPLFHRAAPGARFVVHMHQDDLARLDAAHAARGLSSVDAVVTVSDFVTERTRRHVPEFASRVHTIGNGVDIDRFEPDPERSPAACPRRLLFVGRVSPDKGVHLLVEAFDRLARDHPEVELDVVGKPGLLPFETLRLLLGDDPALEDLRKFYGVSTLGWLSREVLGQRSSYMKTLRGRLSEASRSRVRFRGTISLPELVELYRRADLLVLPSIWQESYGLPVAEAMANGVPVLASRSGGIPELVQDGVTGQLVPRGDLKALTAVLRDMLGDPVRLREMGRAARARAEERLTWRRSAARLEGVYEGLLNGNGRPPPDTA